MAEFITNGIIRKGDKVYRHGSKITLTEEQAERLGNKVIPTAVADPEKSFEDMTLKELRPLAKTAGIESYSTKNRDVLVEELSALQVEEVSGDESSGD